MSSTIFFIQHISLCLYVLMGGSGGFISSFYSPPHGCRYKRNIIIFYLTNFTIFMLNNDLFTVNLTVRTKTGTLFIKAHLPLAIHLLKKSVIVHFPGNKRKFTYI